MTKYIGVIFLAFLLLFTGCQTTKKDVGTVLGGVLGGVVGSQIGPRGSNEKVAAIIAGTLLGGWLGGQLGDQMDEEDARKAKDAELQAYQSELGSNIDWNNKRTGNYGSVTPMRDGIDADGNQCREFKETVTIEGNTETAYGTACKDNDGKWRVVDKRNGY